MIDKINYEGTFLLMLVLVILMSVIYFLNNNPKQGELYHDTTLAENVLISSEWTEIDAKSLVKITRDVHLIGIVLAPPFETPLQEKGIKVDSGEIINPEIKLIDEDNNEYLFIRSGARGTKISNYRYDGTLPVNVAYKKVLLKSKYPIEAKKILWTGYNIKDLK